MDHPSNNPHVSMPILRFPSHALTEKGILTEETAGDSWVGNRTRWMVFEGDPFRMLADVSARSTMTSISKVINGQAAVMMPFDYDASIDPAYKAMQKGAGDAGFQCIRVDEQCTPTNIVEDIYRLIAESQVVIADLTGQKSNVLYEAGFARGLKKPTIFISQDDPSELPFDLGQQRTFQYQMNQAGLNALAARIADALRSVD